MALWPHSITKRFRPISPRPPSGTILTGFEFEAAINLSTCHHPADEHTDYIRRALVTKAGTRSRTAQVLINSFTRGGFRRTPAGPTFLDKGSNTMSVNKAILLAILVRAPQFP